MAPPLMWAATAATRSHARLLACVDKAACQHNNNWTHYFSDGETRAQLKASDDLLHSIKQRFHGLDLSH